MDEPKVEERVALTAKGRVVAATEMLLSPEALDDLAAMGEFGGISARKEDDNATSDVD